MSCSQVCGCRVTSITMLRIASLALCSMLLLCGLIQSHDPGLHPWIRTLSPRSYEHLIYCGYATLQGTQSSIPMGLQYLGPCHALLSQGTTSLSRVGYLVCLYIG